MQHTFLVTLTKKNWLHKYGFILDFLWSTQIFTYTDFSLLVSCAEGSKMS